jgi:hypothetical protein
MAQVSKTITKPSLEAIHRFHDCINGYFSQFSTKEDSLFIGPIAVGTPQDPRVVAPIEVDLKDMQASLGSARTRLTEAIGLARESARLTRETMLELKISSREAKLRNAVMEEIADELERTLEKFRGIAWHPGCYHEVRRIIKTRSLPADPGIRIEIVTEYLV